MKQFLIVFLALMFFLVQGNAQPRSETIFLQTDQPAYLAGSGINIKAWVFLGDRAKLDFSNMYIRLLNAQQEVLASTLLPVWNGHGSGGLKIPPGTAESVYYLHAYTSKTIRSFGQYGHIIPVPILHTGSEEQLVRDTSFQWKGTVHVEGGQLLSGLSTKVVVRMVSDFPRSFGWSAEVRNRAGQVVANLMEKDDNIALGWLIPRSGEDYTAYIKDARGTEISASLPAVRDTGTFLQVNVGPRNIRCGVLLRGISPANAPITIRGIQQGEIVYTACMARETTEAASYIPLDSLSRGTLYLEVTDASGRLLADRLCHVPLAASNSIQGVDTLNAPLKNRALQTFRIRTREGIPWFFAHARAVVDTGFEEQDNLPSRLYLSSLSPDPFFRPARYFQGDSLLPLLDAAHISLTDIYRNEMHQRDSVFIPMHDSLLSFNGLAYDRSGPRRNQEINLVIQYGEGDASVRQVVTDSTGAFRLDNLSFVDSAKVFYQINAGKNRDRNDLSLSIRRTEGTQPPRLDIPRSGWIRSNSREGLTGTYPSDRFTEAFNSEQTLAKNYKALEEIRITATKKDKTRKLDRELSSVLFRSEDEIIMDLVNDHPEATGYRNIFAYIQGRLAPMQVFFQNGKYLPFYRGEMVAITIDEIRSEPEMVDGLNPLDIAMVKFQRYNLLIGGPAVTIYTRKMKPKPSNPGKVNGMNMVHIQGYGREFPRARVNYLDAESTKLEIDNRINLYWNYIRSGDEPDFMETLRFFRNDTGKPYWLTITGIRDNGVPAVLIDRPF